MPFFLKLFIKRLWIILNLAFFFSALAQCLGPIFIEFRQELRMIAYNANQAFISISQTNGVCWYGVVRPWHVVICISHVAHTLSARP